MGERESVSDACFYLDCLCNAFGPLAKCLGHTRFIQIDLALLSGNGLLNVNFRISSTRTARDSSLQWQGEGGGGEQGFCSFKFSLRGRCKIFVCTEEVDVMCCREAGLIFFFCM